MRTDGTTDRRTGGQMDTKKLIIFASHNFSNASKMFFFFNFSFLNINHIRIISDKLE